MVFGTGKRLRRPLRRFFSDQSKVGDLAIFDSAVFDWTQRIEGESSVIRNELDRVPNSRDRLPRFQDISRDNSRIAYGNQWRVFMLFGMGVTTRTRLGTRFAALRSWVRPNAFGSDVRPHCWLS